MLSIYDVITYAKYNAIRGAIEAELISVEDTLVTIRLVTLNNNTTVTIPFEEICNELVKGKITFDIFTLYGILSNTIYEDYFNDLKNQENKYLLIGGKYFTKEQKIEYIKKGLCVETIGNTYDIDILLEIANNGLNLDYLFYRATTLSKPDGDKLKIAIIKQKYGLDRLVYDIESTVRVAVARVGYGLDILENDESYLVKLEVVNQGYNLNKFLTDHNNLIRKRATEKVIEQMRETVEKEIKYTNYKVPVNKIVAIADSMDRARFDI